MKKVLCVFAVAVLLVVSFVLPASAAENVEDLGTIVLTPGAYDDFNVRVHSTTAINQAGQFTGYLWLYDIGSFKQSIFHFDFGAVYKVTIRIHEQRYNYTSGYEQIYYWSGKTASGTFDFTNNVGKIKIKFEFSSDSYPDNSACTLEVYPLLTDDQIYGIAKSDGADLATANMSYNDQSMLMWYLDGRAIGADVSTSSEYQSAFNASYNQFSAEYAIQLAARRKWWEDTLQTQRDAAEQEKADAITAAKASEEYQRRFAEGSSGALSKEQLKAKISGMFASLKDSSDHVLDGIKLGSITLRSIVASVVIIAMFALLVKVVRR